MADISLIGSTGIIGSELFNSLTMSPPLLERLVEEHRLELVDATSLRLRRLALRAKAAGQNDLNKILNSIVASLENTADDIARYRSGMEVLLKASRLIETLERSLP